MKRVLETAREQGFCLFLSCECSGSCSISSPPGCSQAQLPEASASLRCYRLGKGPAPRRFLCSLGLHCFSETHPGSRLPLTPDSCA